MNSLQRSIKASPREMNTQDFLKNPMIIQKEV